MESILSFSLNHRMSAYPMEDFFVYLSKNGEDYNLTAKGGGSFRKRHFYYSSKDNHFIIYESWFDGHLEKNVLGVAYKEELSQKFYEKVKKRSLQIFKCSIPRFNGVELCNSKFIDLTNGCPLLNSTSQSSPHHNF